MTFIKSNPPVRNGKTTKGLYIGKPEAEGETTKQYNFSDYYEDFLDINSAIINGKFIIVGRKGVGKTAYVKHLCDNSSLERELLCNVVNSNNSYLQKIIQSVPDGIGNKASLIYEWIILTEFVRLIISNQNLQYSKGYDELKRFEQKNSGIVDIDKWMSVTETESVKLDVNYYDLVKCFPVIFGKHLDRTQSKAPFYKIIPSLRNVVVEMLGYDANSGINYIVLFDDLDIHFNLRNEDQKKDLMELIRISRDYNTKYLPNQDMRVIILLRDDIAMQLDGIAPDKNKIFSSYEYKLQWYNTIKEASEEKSKLRLFINKRIAIGLKAKKIKYDENDPWSSLIDDRPHEKYKWKTAFKYILDCTLYRPRDLVAFFSDIGDCDYHIPLSPIEVSKCLRRYVGWNAREIKDELSNMYSKKQIDSIFSIFRFVANSNVSVNYDMLLDLFLKNELSEDDLLLLIDYNLFVPKDDTDRQYFSYRENHRLDNPQSYIYSLPKCLYFYFKPNLICI